jgi:energy-coupling factor transporter ATP-binding protein EcfA2
MARAPLLQITGLSLGYGGPPLFDGLDLVVQRGDRLALVGRNGSGKSTLMKVMAGLVEPDAGARVLPDGTGSAISNRIRISRFRHARRFRDRADRRLGGLARGGGGRGARPRSLDTGPTAPRAGSGGARRWRGSWPRRRT